MKREYEITAKDESKQVTVPSYSVVKVNNEVKPWRIRLGTGEELGGRYFSQEEAEAVIAEREHYQSPKRADHKTGVDETSLKQLLERETPAGRDYWRWKAENLRPSNLDEAAWVEAMNTEKSPATG